MGKFYTGLSDDISRRIYHHNVGHSKWTRGKGPWTIIWQSEEMNLSSARILELLLKRQNGVVPFSPLIRFPRVGPQAHTFKVAGSNPAPATNFFQIARCVSSFFRLGA